MISVHQTTRVILITAFAFSVGCTSGPKRENDSPLDYLNGNNYRAGSPQGLSPVFVRQAVARTVSGTLFIDTASLPLPLKHQTLVLTRENKEIARAMTDAKGEFTLTGDIENGNYTITVESNRYALSKEIAVTSYKTEGLELLASTRDAKSPTQSQSR
ncbi:MAG: hypothetical protein A2428_13625 [Bdellovibrionales bacterium RIFOXYC1_FULL_54_43]|nr:MAG: hypothetical protein A2428_13625 [Bdellovibrionales bacterium RIFOXYC1_FULL_54_43]OFZ83180.1 MAG: hypothetical protein A2603_00365 [Bdellovibrionales bacterium RIFOXYD1_FULL_55_31]